MLGEMFTDMLTKTRAADNQMFVMTISQARMDDRMKDMVYGHSLIVDGYGKVVKRLNDREEMLYLDIGKWTAFQCDCLWCRNFLRFLK